MPPEKTAFEKVRDAAVAGLGYTAIAVFVGLAAILWGIV